MTEIDLDGLLSAVSAGGSTCLTSVTELAPAAGPHASVAPAKFASSSRNDKKGTYAFEPRYLDGDLVSAALLDSKQSQLNRLECSVCQAIAQGHPLLGRLPRLVVRYERDGVVEEYSDLELPHRAFDGHFRAGSVDGVPVTQLPEYRAIRNANVANARPLLDASPASLVFGSWDSTRSSHQGRWRSIVVGEIIGYCGTDAPALKGGARTDPVGMRIQLSDEALKDIAQRQRDELSANLWDKVNGKDRKPSHLGLGGIAPSLEALAGVACHRIVRSHVVSFAALRQIRFGAGPKGDEACRALLAALALNALARSDAELALRANCDLVEASPAQVRLDERGGRWKELTPLDIPRADALLGAALAHAEEAADVRWDGVVLRVDGDPAIVAGAGDDADGESGS